MVFVELIRRVAAINRTTKLLVFRVKKTWCYKFRQSISKLDKHFFQIKVDAGDRGLL